MSKIDPRFKCDKCPYDNYPDDYGTNAILDCRYCNNTRMDQMKMLLYIIERLDRMPPVYRG